MKKLLVILLSLMLAAPAAVAQEEVKPLAQEELNAWTEALVSRAIADGLAVTEKPEGLSVDGRGYSLYPTDKDLSADTTLSGAVVDRESLEVDGLTGPRSLIVTQAAGAVLEAFPNDNPELRGTADQAVLYLRGALPETVSTGILYRSGQEVNLIEYSVYAMGAEAVERSGVLFTMENGAVTAIRYFGGEQVPLAEAEQHLATLSQLQEKDEYFSFAGQSGAPLEREDLSVGGLDFIDLTPDSAETVWGKPDAEETAQDSNGETLLTKQWRDVFVTFSVRDGVARADHVVLHGAVPGPRAVTAGETLMAVLERFENNAASLTEETVALYGDSADAAQPYGLLSQKGGSQTLYYSVPVENGSVLMTCAFINDVLVETTLQRQ